MRIGASTGALYPQYLTEDAVEALARLGFPTIEVMLQTAGEYQPDFARLLAARASDRGVEVYSVHAFSSLHPLFDRYARRRQEGLDQFRRAVDLAVKVGAVCLVWHGLTQRDVEAGSGVAALRDVLPRLVEIAAEAGLRLSIENVSWCWAREAAQFLEMREWDVPLGFTFDPFQAAEAKTNVADLLGAMGDRLVNVHASDRAASGGKRHLPIGAGTINWPQVLRLLARAEYNGPLMLECACDGDLDRLARSRDILAALLPGPGRG